MKNRTTIVLIIILIITIVIGIGITIVFMKKNDKNQIESKKSLVPVPTNNQINQENNLTVKMRYNTGKYDTETYELIMKEISLTKEQQNEIINFYKNTDLINKQASDLAFIGRIQLELSDGNSIAMDDNRDEYALLNHKKIIKISKEFKQYILNIIND